MHAIPIPYRFQYEKCKKKSWELQAYTYTAFVAPLQKYSDFGPIEGYIADTVQDRR